MGKTQYCLSDGAYIATTSNVQIAAKMQALAMPCLLVQVDYLIGQSSGVGQVAVGGFSFLFMIDGTPSKEIVVDNGHVFAWDASLNYQIAASTSNSQGLFGNLVNSVTSGEGVALRFTGSGKCLCAPEIRTVFWLSLQPR